MYKIFFEDITYFLKNSNNPDLNSSIMVKHKYKDPHSSFLSDTFFIMPHKSEEKVFELFNSFSANEEYKDFYQLYKQDYKRTLECIYSTEIGLTTIRFDWYRFKWLINLFKRLTKKHNETCIKDDIFQILNFERCTKYDKDSKITEEFLYLNVPNYMKDFINFLELINLCYMESNYRISPVYTFFSPVS